MIIRKIAGIFSLVLCFHFLGAQNFATRQLEYLSELMNCSLPQQSGTFNCTKITHFPLLIEYDDAHNICHIGVSIFPESVKNDAGKPVCDFQERLFLELLLQKDETKARKLLEEYKVQYLEPNLGFGSFYNSLNHFLNFASGANEYVLTKDSLTWLSLWHNSNQTLSLRFPSNFDLILGMDKKEAEIWIAKQLQHFHCKSSDYFPIFIDSMELEPLNPEVYVKRGNHLFAQNMNSNLYFSTPTDSSWFNLLYDRKFPVESITNLFNYPNQNAEGMYLQIKQVAYGGNAPSYKIKLSDFQCFMRDDNVVFCGIEKCSADVVEFSVIYQNRYYNCYHLLFIQTTPKILFDKTAALQGLFYTFIPNQNINNLYKEHIEKREIPVKLKN